MRAKYIHHLIEGALGDTIQRVQDHISSLPPRNPEEHTDTVTKIKHGLHAAKRGIDFIMKGYNDPEPGTIRRSPAMGVRG